jgi:putative membrane protein
MVLAACLAIIVAMPLSGFAQSRTDRDSTAAAKKSAAPDEKFLKRAAVDNKAEDDLGRLAGDRGSSQSVKQFGQRMVTDHGKAIEELQQLAQQKGVSLPADTDAKHKKTYDRLSKLSGDQFDREYMKHMVREHDADVKAFKREAERAKDPDVKSWAGKTLPVLEQHQQQAHQIQTTLKGSGGSASPPAKSSK